MSLSKSEESRQLMSIFPDLVRELTFEGEHKDVPVINKHLSKVMSVKYQIWKKDV